MAFLINSTRLTRVDIGGEDFTDQTLDISLSDSSGVKNGLIATDGEISLGYRPGGKINEDYGRNHFSRGMQIDIFVTYPDGTEEKHPRGRLYIIDSKFDPQKESIILSVGCKMALHALDGDISEIKDLPNFYLPSTRQNYSSISAALAAESRIAWYDRDGLLQSAKLWEGEGSDYSATAKWVSVFGVTTLAISSLDSSRSISSGKSSGNPYSGGDPDNIELTYQYAPRLIDGETGFPADEEGGFIKEEVSTSESKYYTQYPVIFYAREPSNTGEDEGTSDGIPDLETVGLPEMDKGLESPRPSDCAQEFSESDNPASADNKPGGGAGNGDTNCMSGMTTVRTPLYVGVESSSETTNFYGGPGGALSKVVSVKRGPALEANNQYYGDLYQLCRQSWATRCNPNGYCGTDAGTKQLELSRSVQLTEYNPDGSVKTVTTDEYKPLLTAASTDNWRAGVVDGVMTSFRSLGFAETTFFRDSRNVVEYQYPENGTYRKTTSYQSIRSRGPSNKLDSNYLDAINGVVKTTVDSSTSNVINEDQPQSQVSPEPSSLSDVSIVAFPSHDLPGTDSSLKPLVYKESVPYPFWIIAGSNMSWEQSLSEYEDYTRRNIKGASLGLRLGESLRQEIASEWKPNTSFRYHDPRYNILISMRSNAQTWSMTPEECVMTVDGMAVGFSNGQVNIPDNIVGVTTAILP